MLWATFPIRPARAPAVRDHICCLADIRPSSLIPPLGYDLDETKHIVVNEAEAEIVRTIFRMYLDGYSYSDIAKALNTAGHTTKIGNPFNKNSFSSLLC